MVQKSPTYRLLRRETSVKVVVPIGKHMKRDEKNGCWRHGEVVGYDDAGKPRILSEVFFGFVEADLGKTCCAIAGVEEKTLPDRREYTLVTYVKTEGSPTKVLDLVDGVPAGAIKLLQNSAKSLVFRPIMAVAPTASPQAAQASA
jgi:hypothetical protein